MPRTAVAACRRGTVTVWLVVCLGVILGIVALGLDGGRMMEERRHAQAAADAAALAAGADLYRNYRQNKGTDPDNTAQAAALASALANGYANDGTTSQVEVNIPPQSGTFAGQAGYAEVVVHSYLPGTFSALFTSGPLAVKARAVARGQPQKVGLLLLQASGDDSLDVSGNASVQVIGAGVQVDSTSSLAYNVTGSGSVSAAVNDVAGSTAPSGNIAGPINTSVPPAPDPLQSLPAPTLADYPVQATGATALTSGSTTLQPGV